jgi:hypothetical protein
LSQEEVLYYQHRTEPSLDELFEEFAVQLLMRRDGVTESGIRTLLSEMKNARAGASAGSQPGPGALISATDPPRKSPSRKRKTVGSRRAAQSSEARKIPIRFI